MAGIRHFKLEALPPLAFHNPNLEITFKTHQAKDVPPEITLDLKDGSSHVIDCFGLRDAVILEKVYEIDGSNDSARQPFRSHKHVVYFE